MVTDEIVKRINDLYNKSKAEGLTGEEKEEQEKLRRLYVDSVKENLRAQLKTIKVVSEDEYEELTENSQCGGGCGCGCKCSDDGCKK